MFKKIQIKLTSRLCHLTLQLLIMLSPYQVPCIYAYKISSNWITGEKKLGFIVVKVLTYFRVPPLINYKLYGD